MIELVIPSKPFGKQRPRIGKFGAYTPQKTINYETLVKYTFITKYPDFKPFEGAVSIDVLAVFAPPKSYRKKKQKELLVKPYTKKPDYDNIAKIVSDALNTLAYKDDAQVARAVQNKVYGEVDKVVIQIEEISEG